jgi:electron transfer flavoprotein alpha subunit
VRVAVLIKQVPRFEEMSLGPDGRLRREGLELEINPYCRRAVAKGVELARAAHGRCTVFTLGPPPAEDALREAVAWGADDAVLITDPVFAGSDTLATSRALAQALRREGPFDLILAGRNSVDADTGQVAAEIAELLDLPMLAGVRILDLHHGVVHAHCEQDDGWLDAELRLPAVITAAERLCPPCKVGPEGRAAVHAEHIRRMGPADIGEGPWGQAGSPTTVGRVRVLEVQRRCQVLDGDIGAQVRQAVDILRRAGALDGTAAELTGTVPDTGVHAGTAIAVLVEQGRPRIARELLGAAARLAVDAAARVVAICTEDADPVEAGGWGADELVLLHGSTVEEDVAAAAAEWCTEHTPWAVLAASTMWGREVAGRVAARLGAGLTGDAVELEVADGRLVCWKPAFGGQLVAAITASSPVQMATVRPGVLPLLHPRRAQAADSQTRTIAPRGRVHIVERGRDDELDALATARTVVTVGTGVLPEEYALLQPLRDALGAELGATRKVADRGWLPHSRQVGITGRAIAPCLYVAVGVAGKFNHIIGFRAAHFALAINSDPSAPIFDAVDLGIVGDWHEVVPLLVRELAPAESAARP